MSDISLVEISLEELTEIVQRDNGMSLSEALDIELEIRTKERDLMVLQKQIDELKVKRNNVNDSPSATVRTISSQAENYLRSSKWIKESETLVNYIEKMERLRSLIADDRVSKSEFVCILLRGMNLPSKYYNLLSFPITIEELKDRLHGFELIPQASNSSSTTAFDVSTRCYKCSYLGHFESCCPFDDYDEPQDADLSTTFEAMNIVSVRFNIFMSRGAKLINL